MAHDEITVVLKDTASHLPHVIPLDGVIRSVVKNDERIAILQKFVSAASSAVNQIDEPITCAKIECARSAVRFRQRMPRVL